MSEYQERTSLAVLDFSSPLLMLHELQAGCWSGLGSCSWLVDPCAAARRAVPAAGPLALQAPYLQVRGCVPPHWQQGEGPQGSVALTPCECA